MSTTKPERGVINPSPFLKSLFGKQISVKLKWGITYEGTLACADAYMNVHMIDVKEYTAGEYKGDLKELLIRCNNILYISDRSIEEEAEEEEEGDKED